MSCRLFELYFVPKVPFSVPLIVDHILMNDHRAFDKACLVNEQSRNVETRFQICPMWYGAHLIFGQSTFWPRILG